MLLLRFAKLTAFKQNVALLSIVILGIVMLDAVMLEVVMLG